MRSPDLVNFVTALAYHFCLNLPAGFTNLAQNPIIRLYALNSPHAEADFALTHAWDVVVVGDSLREEPVADLPGEDGGALPLVVGDLGDHRGRRHARLGAADRARLDRPSLVVPARHKRGVKYNTGQGWG